MQLLFQRLGLSFEEEKMLNWSTIENQEIPDDWKYFAQEGWYDDVLSSSSIKEKNHNVLEEETDEELLKLITKDIPIFEKFVKAHDEQIKKF